MLITMYVHVQKLQNCLLESRRCGEFSNLLSQQLSWQSTFTRFGRLLFAGLKQSMSSDPLKYTDSVLGYKYGHLDRMIYTLP